MKIAIVTPWNVRCGIASYSYALSKSLAQIKDNNIFIVRSPRFGERNAELMRNLADKVPIKDIDVILVEHEYGLFQGHEDDFYQELSAVSDGKPVITTLHATGFMDVDKIVSDHSDAVIIHNKYCASRMVTPSKVVVIPHGVVKGECPPKDECSRKMGVQHGANVVGYCSFISAPNGLDILVNAMADVKKAGLLIGGGWHVEGRDTSYMAKVKDMCAKTLPSRYQWMGYIPDEQLPTAFGAMDVVVYPKRMITESGGVLTALGHGKAVLTTKLPPNVEKEKAGALMTFKNVKDLGRKINKILGDDDLRLKLEQGAKKYADAHSWDLVAKYHMDLFEKIITDRCSKKKS